MIILDKTGTITEGKPQVTDIVAIGDMDEKEILEIAAALEQKSEHPLAEAIVRRAEEMNTRNAQVESFQAIP